MSPSTTYTPTPAKLHVKTLRSRLLLRLTGLLVILAVSTFLFILNGMESIPAFARALLAAHRILEDSEYKAWRKERYASFDQGSGADFEGGKMSLTDLYQYAADHGEPAQRSGRQELFENLINDYI